MHMDGGTRPRAQRYWRRDKDTRAKVTRAKAKQEDMDTGARVRAHGQEHSRKVTWDRALGKGHRGKVTEVNVYWKGHKNKGTAALEQG